MLLSIQGFPKTSFLEGPRGVKNLITKMSEKPPENKNPIEHWKPFKKGEVIRLKELFKLDRQGIKDWRDHFEKLGIVPDQDYEIEEVDPEFLVDITTRDWRERDDQLIKLRGVDRWIDARHFEREKNDPWSS